ncbi:PP2C family protein-serine/threonine phosphatase [Nocardioides pacificus]
MPRLLLVGLTPDEHRAAVPEPCPVPMRAVRPDELADVLHDEVCAVVVGGTVPRSVSVVQQVHLTVPSASVVMLCDEHEVHALRGRVRFAPGVPVALEIAHPGEPGLTEMVAQMCAVGVSGQRHDQLLAELERREPARPPLLVTATLGALLENVPVGILLADADRRLLVWNPSAATLVGLGSEATGTSVTSLFAEAAALDAALASAQRGVTPETVTTQPATPRLSRQHLDLSAVHTHLSDGRDATLIIVQDASARLEAQQQRDRLSSQIDLIGLTSVALAGSVDRDEALVALADQVVPRLCDWVSMQLFDDRMVTRHVVVRHRDPELARLAELAQGELAGGLSDETPSRRIARGEGPMLLAEVSQDELHAFVPDPTVRAHLEELGVASAIAVPLTGREAVLGSMILLNRAGSPTFGERELAVAVELGRRAGLAMESIELYGQQRAFAEELQRSLLTEPPVVERIETVVRYLPAAHGAQVGGDWYDSFPQSDGATLFVIGDVVGHDSHAAGSMGQLRGLLRGISYATEDGTGPATMLRALDDAVESLLQDTTASVLVARVPSLVGSTGDAPVLWSNAGHPPPALIPADGGPTRLFPDDADLLLGVDPTVPRVEHETRLAPGDTLVLYTDGLVERRDRDLGDGLADLTRILDGLRERPLDDLCDALVGSLLPPDHEDDVAVLAVRLLP